MIFIVWVTLFVQRFGHMQRSPPSASDLADGDAAMRYFGPVEMPVRYFALIPLLLITHHANHVQVILAWAFVVLRAVHSLIHIAPKNVQPRFFVYLIACAILSAMWIGFAIDMLHSADVYDAALRNMQG
ncbi:MAG: hypothetical protein JWM65_2206 [Sphingomonas bacterium]|nr:hypothetical protein [Sphingomonas bacterium]